jgi:thiol-disulfide isomerase/thioredoxin
MRILTADRGARSTEPNNERLVEHRILEPEDASIMKSALRAVSARTFMIVPMAALLVFGDAAAGANAPPKFSMHGVPRPLPDVAFHDAAGRPVHLSDFRGKVVVLNIWATWCGPCRKEMPTLDRLQAKLGGSNFEVVALSADSTGPGAVRKFFRFIGVRHLSTYIDESSEALSILRVPALPTTLLLDRNGAEIGRLTGPAEWDSAVMLRFLRGVIGAPREDRTVSAPARWLSQTTVS